MINSRQAVGSIFMPSGILLIMSMPNALTALFSALALIGGGTVTFCKTTVVEIIGR